VVNSKQEPGVVKRSLELRRTDQLREDVIKVMSIWQLTLSLKTIQHSVLYLTNQEVNHIEH
jgi:hypothetical protein